METTPPTPISVAQFFQLIQTDKYHRTSSLRIAGIIDGKRLLKELAEVWHLDVTKAKTVFPDRFVFTGPAKQRVIDVEILMSVSVTRMDGDDLRRTINAIVSHPRNLTERKDDHFLWTHTEGRDIMEYAVRQYVKGTEDVERLAQLLRCRKLSSDFIVEWIAPAVLTLYQ